LKIIELNGVGYINSGALLMMRACKQRIIDLGMTPVLSMLVGSHSQRRKEEVDHLIHFPDQLLNVRYVLPRVAWEAPAVAIRCVPGGIKKRLNIWGYADLSAVLDVSGFRYSDQIGTKYVVRALARANYCKKHNQKYVMLPQAFGPFEDPSIRSPMRELVDASDAVFARDRTSLDHLIGVALNSAKIRLAPDFTNLLAPCDTRQFSGEDEFAIIVPNKKMIEKTGAGVADHYRAATVHIARSLASSGLRVVVMIHEQKDRILAEELAEAAGLTSSIISDDDPLVLKQILGRSALVVGARYHALISALSQGVPCIGFGWSHKYRELFTEYGCPEALVDPLQSRSSVHNVVNNILDENHRENMRALISENALRIRQEAAQMWRQVETHLTQ